MENKKSKTRKYYYCECDNFGQRTGMIETVELKKNEIENKNHCIYYNGNFLYKNYTEALYAALD